MPNNPSQVQFQKVPVMNLNPDGSITDKSGQTLEKPVKPAEIGIPQEDFEKQVMTLAQQGIALPKIQEAIDQHTEITDKDAAKGMAEAIYQIAGTMNPT